MSVPDERRAIGTGSQMSVKGSLEAPFLRAIFLTVFHRNNVGVFTTDIGTGNAAVVVTMMLPEVYAALHPLLWPIIAMAEDLAVGSGTFKADESATMESIFQWLREQPTQCAAGWLEIGSTRFSARIYVMGFAGEKADSAIDVLKCTGLKIPEEAR